MTDVNSSSAGTENDENTEDGTESAGPRLGDAETHTDTFPREYVETLRKESADHRDRAKTAEERAEVLAKRLHAELVRSDGTLVDPDALPFDPEHLDDNEKLSAAIETLTAAKPYLKARKATGDAGQGPRGGTRAAPGWADLFN